MDSSFFGCYHYEDGASGTIFDENGATSTFTRLNFTSCLLLPMAAANDGVGAILYIYI
jgi:hypothetical protein